MRSVLDGIFYIKCGGIAWRYMPREYPPWKTAYRYFRIWCIDGVWERINNDLRAQVRQQEGCERKPSAAILDSQSVKTTDCGGPSRDYDAGKRVI